MIKQKISSANIESSRKMNTQKLGLFISDMRNKKSWTQEQLADYMNVNKASISRWENGVFAPDIFKLVKLADLLDVSVYDLLCGEILENDNEKINEAAVNGVKIYSKEMLRKCFIIFFSIFIVIGIIFFILLKIESNDDWKVYNLIDTSNEFDYGGYIVKNDNNIIVSVNDIVYNGSHIGMKDEPFVKKILFNFYEEDRLIYTYKMNVNKELLHDVLNHYNLFFEIEEKVKRVDNCKLVISYTFWNEYKDEHEIFIKYKN